MPPKTGRVVAGRYRLIESIGRGAMGVVWRATDQLLDRDVAVKEVRLNPALGDLERANAYKRTLREARTAARLSHRGVVTIFDVVEEDDRPWIIMELIRSRSLDEILSTEGRLPPRRAARVAQQLLSALAHAHAAGVLHRDVKPSNVLISAGGYDNRAVLTDFGIAQFEGDSRLTQTGMVMGSPGFTAPERIRGGSATPASDLWSLGATIYAACEGQGPYEHRGGAITTMSAIINEDAPSARAAGRLGSVIAALLSRDPARRPSASSAASLIDRILPALPDAPATRPRTPTTLSPTSRPTPPAPATPSPGVAPTGIDPPQSKPATDDAADQNPSFAPPSRTDPPAPAPQPLPAKQDSPEDAASGGPASEAPAAAEAAQAPEAAEAAEQETDDPNTAPFDATADDDGPDTAPYDAATDTGGSQADPAGASDVGPADKRDAVKSEALKSEAFRKTSRIITPSKDEIGSPAAGKSNADNSAAASDSAGKDPAAKDPTAKDPAVKDPTAKDPTAKDPTAKDSAVKDPTAKDPTAKDPTAKDSAVKDPAAKDPTAKDETDKSTAGKSSTDKSAADKSAASKSTASKSTAGKSTVSEHEVGTIKAEAGRDTTRKGTTAEGSAKKISAKKDSVKEDAAGKEAAGRDTAGKEAPSGSADVAALAEGKAPALGVVTSAETTMRDKPSVAASSPSPRTAVKAPPTASTTRTPKPATADKEPWWANAYQPERRPGPPIPATKPDGCFPLAPTLQQPPARQGPSRAGSSGTSGAGRQSSELAPPYSAAEAGGSAASGASGAGRKRSRKALLLVLALVIIVAVGAVMATVLSEHGGTATAAQTTPSHATGTIPAVTTSSPALIVALNDTGGTAPADFAASTFTPTQTGTTDGFTMSYPGSWQVKQHSGSPQRVYFDAQDAVSNVEVDLTPHTKSNMVTEAQYIRGQTLAQGSFPSYKQIRLSAENVRGTPGAIWEFYYTNSAGTMMKAEDILFILHTSNGPQSYAIFAASPNSVWQSTMLPRVEDMLKTFQPNP